MSLRTLCRAALNELGTFDVPNTFVNSNNPDARQCYAFANKIGKMLIRMYRWEVLQTSYTFTTVNGTAAYDLPDDFHKFSNITFWDRSNYWEMIGPATAAQWQQYKSGIVEIASRKVFRIAGNQFVIHPTPTSADTIAYDYQSNKWVLGAASVGSGDSIGGGIAAAAASQDEFESDDDTSRIDEELIKLGVKYQFKAAKGLPYGEEKEEFEAYLSQIQADDGAKPVLNFGGGLRLDNFPQTDFGS